MRVWILTVLAVVLLAAAAAAAAVLAWPAGAIGASPTGLASISLPGFSGRVEKVSVTDGDGRALPVSLHRG
ncbi:MAG TPA: hypothetical protein VJ814_06275, partial [Gaiellaceae bacterium]|nr:hypothetical protein [Gaiellaceae bacterium]